MPMGCAVQGDFINVLFLEIRFLDPPIFPISRISLQAMNRQQTIQLFKTYHRQVLFPLLQGYDLPFRSSGGVVHCFIPVLRVVHTIDTRHHAARICHRHQVLSHAKMGQTTQFRGTTPTLFVLCYHQVKIKFNVHFV